MKNKKVNAARRFVLGVALLLAAMITDTATNADYAHAGSARLNAITRVVGLHEVKNRKTIQAMVGVNPARTPWCGAAVGYAVRKTGGKPPQGFNKAISWKNWGKPVSLKNAQAGDVVIFRFKRGYHVALFKGMAGNGKVAACGGNMSNRFKCSNYSARSVVAVRR